MKFFIYLMLFCLTLFGCGKRPAIKEVSVGLDSNWYTLELGGRENNVTAFTIELLREIGQLENIKFKKIKANWDDLLSGLHTHKYDAIASSLHPYNFNQKTYNFSQLYLATGPVLVVPIASKILSLNELDGKEIAVLPNTGGELLLEKYPGVLIRTSESIPKTLSGVVDGTFDGAILDVLFAAAYCRDLYQGQLKIATPPLNDEGLRLISLHMRGATDELAASFNRGLIQLKNSGRYDKLLSKWNLK